ncbi:MAG: hypothetical protein M1816_005022 [Peltula sp. TS41687]|nr:MAG: hypothetical protein M1816_005022 [Peltula sp. TS41687]
MSATAPSITARAFALALHDLPLENLYLKAAELYNSLNHLRDSNAQLQPYAEAGDRECLDAVQENEEVIRRMEERIGLLRREVERRGFRWTEVGEEDKVVARGGQVGDGDGQTGEGLQGHERERESGRERDGQQRSQGGSLSDEELRRRLRERLEAQMDMRGDDGGNEEGVHL